MNALLIDNEVKADLNRLVEYAETHPFSIDDLLDIQNGVLPPPGDNPERVCLIPFDYRIVYSIEQQLKGDVRHLSMSVSGENKLPSIQAVETIMGFVGFKNGLQDCMKYLEDVSENHQAINILEFC
jgi:hypothetical protein